MTEKCINIYKGVFYSENGVCCFAPGRVNLIGEHTDYNGGYVLPCALPLGIYGAAAKRSDKKIRLYSADFKDNGIIEADLDNIIKTNSWADYPLGVIKAFSQFGFKLESGFDMVIVSDLPDGAGLSSSAALEMLTCTVIKKLFCLPVEPALCARIGQSAENRFVGVSCGIMDQFASATGKKDCAVLLNSNTLDYELVGLPLGSYDIVIINSNKKRALAASAFNERRSECQRALCLLKEKTGASFLCDITPEGFERYQDLLDCKARKRARHVIYENKRVTEAARLLTVGDLTGFGRLMNASHFSLRDDYEVSCRELDVLTERARHFEGVFGARMTGAGFGGCAVALTDKSRTADFCEYIKSVYKTECGKEADTYVVSAAEGARFLTEF